MNLRELVDTVDVPETRVAEEAWQRAQARLVRRRTALAAGVGLLVAIVLVGVNALQPRSGQHAPTPMTGSPDPTPTADVESHLPVMIVKPAWEDLGTAPSLAPPADATALSADPVEHAALVMADVNEQTKAFVLGDDGRWRRLDVPSIVPVSDGTYTSPIVVPTALDAGGTRLAIPQPQALVVVDLTTGESRRYAVEGFQHHAIWLDDTQVLVAAEGDATGVVVDLTTGDTEKSDLGPSSRVLPDGNTLTWRWDQPGHEFFWKDKATQSVVDNNGGLQQITPLLRDGLGVVMNGGASLPNPPPPYPPQELTSTVGIAAVDLASGDPVGYVQLAPPLESNGTLSALLGWRGSDPVLGLVSMELSSPRMFIAVWDVDAGTLEPLATLPSWSVSWGVGL